MTAAVEVNHVVALTKRWSHHTKSGGYDRLADELGCRHIARRESSSLVYKAINQYWERFSNHGLGAVAYRCSDWLAEWRVVAGCLTGKTSLVHALYGEEQLNVLLDWKPRLRAKLIASFHLPPDILTRMPATWRQRLKRLDGAICMSRTQIPFLEEATEGSPVEFIPHGIDTEVFSPAPKRKEHKRLQLLCVGSHLRDFNVLNRVAAESERQALPVDFTVICPPRDQNRITATDSIRVRSGVSQEALIDAYRQTDAVFLPLEDATANNCLLEGLACGAPALVTDMPAIRDYVTEDEAVFIGRADWRDAFEKIAYLSADRMSLHARRNPARQRTALYDWQCIATKSRRLYTTVLNKK